jgi:aldose 1-epimerase
MEKALFLCVCILIAAAARGDITSRHWGTIGDKRVDLYTLDNGDGIRAEISNYGATIVSLQTKDRRGRMGDIVLGFNTLDEYRQKSPYFGCVVGRYGNRIAYGSFVLDRITHKLPINNEPAGIPCSLHGGTEGFDKRVWQASATSTAGGPQKLELVLYSPDGDMGYPGNLRVKVVYTLTTNNILRVEYSAVCDKRTPINLTQHSYFNLRGEGDGDILGHRLQLAAARYTPVNAGLIPTGEIANVKGTPLDFMVTHLIGERVNSAHPQMRYGAGYDHNFVLDKFLGEFGLAAKVSEPTSGRAMEVWTTEPGVQFYCGSFLDGSLTGKSGRKYVHRGGFCLETQHYPDSPNQPNFPTTIIEPGKAFRSKTEFRFATFR